MYPVDDENLKPYVTFYTAPITEMFDMHQEDEITTEPSTPEPIDEPWPCSDLDDASVSSDEDVDDYQLLLTTLPSDVIHLIYEGLKSGEDRTCLRLVNRDMLAIIPPQERILKIRSLRGLLAMHLAIPDVPFTAFWSKELAHHEGPLPYTEVEREAMEEKVPTLLPRFKRDRLVVNQVKRHAGATEDVGLDVGISDFMCLLQTVGHQLYLLQVMLREQGYCSEKGSRVYLDSGYKRIVDALLPGARHLAVYGDHRSFLKIKSFVAEGLATWDHFRAYVTSVVVFLVRLENMAGILSERIGYIQPHVVESEWMKYQVYFHESITGCAAMLRRSPLPFNDKLLAKIVRKSNPYRDQLPGCTENVEAPPPAGTDSTLKRVGEPLENPSKRLRLDESETSDVRA